MRRKRFIQLCVRSTTQRRARKPASRLMAWASSPRADVAREAELGQGIAYLLVIITLVQAHALRLVRRWLRPLHDDTFQGGTHQFHVRAVGAGHDQTDGHTMAFGQQAPLDPVFTAIRGVGARLFPTQRRFGHRAIHTGKRPVDALQFIELLHTRLPELEKHIRLHPRLIPIMGGRMRYQFGLIQRLPLTTGAQDVEDGIGARPIRHARPTAAETVRVHMDRQEGQQDRPQGIGDPKVGRRFVVSCTGTSTLRSLFCAHARYSTTSTSYSDRL